MLDNQRFGDNAYDVNNPNSQNLLAGTPVYDVNGDKVGEVSDQADQSRYLLVQKGIFFRKDLYIPWNVVQRQDNAGVYLGLTKDDINSRGWDQLPTAQSSAYDQNAAYATAGDTIDTTDRMTTSSVSTTGNDIVVPERQEQLVGEKTREQVGNIHVSRDVDAVEQTITAPVSHEEAYVERRAGDINTPVSDDAFTEKDIDIPVMGEQLNVAKEAQVTGEVHVGKQRVTEQQQASDTVRREHVNVESNPDEVVNMNDDLTGNDALQRP